MNIQLGHSKFVRRAYGIDEIALVPGGKTVDPENTDTTLLIGGKSLEIPIIASAMDGVVDVNMAVALSKLGSLGVLNLEGVQTRYEKPNDVLKRISSVGKEEFVPLMQEIYKQPIKENLINQRIQEIKDQGGLAAVSGTPLAAIKFKDTITKAKPDLFFLQATVVSTEHIGGGKQEKLEISNLCQTLGIPVIVGNCVTYEVALNLMRAGVSGILVGIGPGAACTSRGVLGVGVPQATAISDCSAARDDYKKETGNHVPVIADGGIITGGDVCKCIACGADGVMIGSPIARASEAPGNGYHWGMATPSPVLPRGTRIKVGSTGNLMQILRGPAKTDDGTHNLLGALKTSMGTLGAQTIKEMQEVEIVIAPSLLSEGKVYQKAQQLGMGK
ncbi:MULTISPECIES: GuaB3 family IMP dehydrogenase-related protein [Prochlorococcus]|uniref:IMP dehydrogenase/GMP reductase n=1 Tax=Prochlorococcus marinus (strain SARG / CCMP1375 / SS120) TaxID=167539 RepID=Q7VBF7_PROMA|nr:MULTISPECIES: GuaB3 family IMP dehydrogenase-related protein [Prochlorococcus]AAQ00183.1 IMP dehydrogenase/GMP reductase [Prochlorococcus marinus subsp. marinus str. CCMP1375]KGG13982.1 IMP dehydrogenase subunit [Prochlorococcus marinus str. LG]KGG19115.1 IMP dehydrogenase subunit [Prochlorococcus marinus str. SS2]KGG23345.1 IMP dehydrogenase subunit [Prochlorococcus marinus str. SS35]KGG32419.1 IMP dehydrogenase subunit [Prochlorococcus marinus str. SS51]